MDEIVVDPGSSAAQFSIMQSQQPPQHGPEVRLTAAGVPRKKPGRKPKPKDPADENSTATEQQPKPRRPRKPRDPNAPPIVRKRKAAATDDAPDAADDHDTSMEMPDQYHGIAQRSKGSLVPLHLLPRDQRPPKIPKRETHPVSMSHLLNEEDPPPQPQPTASRQVFDPIRGSYDPVRETMMSRDVFGTGSIMGSPRAPTSQPVNRASASPSIASLVDPPAPPNIMSPVPSHQTPYNTAATKSRLQESTSATPPSSNPVRSTPQQIAKPQIIEVRRAPPPPPAPAAASQRKPSPPKNSFTSMSTVPPTSSAAAATNAATAAPSTTAPPTNNKKLTALVQQERESTHSRGNKTGSNHSSEAVKPSGGSNSLKDALLPPLPSVGGHGTERSILDFGKVNPGQEIEAPSIKIHIPLNGETNKYVNFMRMAEEQYGWDALHPRQAANRERKARIAAATAALEKSVGTSGRESGEEMDEDIQSDAENSNIEMGGMGGLNPTTNGVASGPEAPAKPARKKRNFKEDEYDIDDDFVDDSEMLWEAQAAASRDGFFVYSGPLIPEVPKPEVAPPARRGRGGGRGSRGGRGGTTRGGANAAGHGADTAASEKPSGRGRGGGPGSRGGRGGGDGTRKPRITKLEKEQRDKEKAERERLAQITAAAKASVAAGGGPYMLGLTPPAAAGGPTAMMID
ncbi:hypothetical protein GE21DRAFT_9757 [Neurospora crassa]|uniref:Hpc2-related domain-containing protein n=2 Tax=Neurospora crassa (strain ATCC 24698 / 74-OR23-1A / CBS 708.71 / DSM 1257 / FGSC 987) TaxID=367110 RepID=V5IKG1_NEUCR|nr:hypothetical protein NCU11000 [Neurospora crassa OR74A]XP_011395319.1 uncharacterized protein NCU11000 [Neurospora crassa OR74A]ESA41817.1 hypothetical protein NCU11000 [Neurospora crassa OR74A]ESA41818.1 hypothetical protein, variant 1 [Neurospora crassa OR74A]KHE86195.1 hypothetical protein GE21DRAFT_9757 [Neurospora crassa]|eukprot:XP_011395318.1 hypothetical protein NCU11000 [Neurospora crassa OR74A]